MEFKSTFLIELIKINYISQADYDKLNSQYSNAKATLDAAKLNLEYSPESIPPPEFSLENLPALEFSPENIHSLE